jgi:glyoxylase-like metal-dependent hydrolase (beta-lactamase superfamily II)
VTVCGGGAVSKTAADILVQRGFDAQSLTGGMKAWSLAWNTAEVPLTDDACRVIQVRRTGKGCLSYVVGSRTEAAVIDPSVSPEVYAQIAQRNGWCIRLVLETHIHADHLSRARDLVHETGAIHVLPTQQRVQFAFTPIDDGGRMSWESASLVAVRTPGHTDESTSYVLNETAVFTGDTLFTNGVGRPDLHADAESARQRSRTLFASLERLRALPPHTIVLPAHTSDPVAFDGRAVSARLDEVERWLSGWLISESAFVERVTSKLPPTPPNFSRIVDLNERGEFPTTDPTDLEAGANRCAVR